MLAALSAPGCLWVQAQIRTHVDAELLLQLLLNRLQGPPPHPFMLPRSCSTCTTSLRPEILQQLLLVAGGKKPAAGDVPPLLHTQPRLGVPWS